MLLATTESFSEVSKNVAANDGEERGNTSIYQKSENDFETALPDGK